MYFNPNKLIDILSKNKLSEKRMVIYLFIFISFGFPYYFLIQSIEEITANIVKIWLLGEPLNNNIIAFLKYGLDIIAFFIIYKYNGTKDILIRYVTLYTTLMFISFLGAFVFMILPIVFLTFDAYILKMYIADSPTLIPFIKFCFEPFLIDNIILNFTLIYYFRKLKKLSCSS
ncbi:hypothetical protein [Silvanigrella aquatica]|uniref:Uncharacterized protein n=1 Tax=Silvanigrella aquatica TaxID=1915309 RepID=A0A1L4D0J7_9BACT|nr:hypothetical protein [Silvanigrella aquatica]APJ03733.1 hypothetical protein AXG55_07365 [Silvanigrella aquatica]